MPHLACVDIHIYIYTYSEISEHGKNGVWVCLRHPLCGKCIKRSDIMSENIPKLRLLCIPFVYKVCVYFPWNGVGGMRMGYQRTARRCYCLRPCACALLAKCDPTLYDAEMGWGSVLGCASYGMVSCVVRDAAAAVVHSIPKRERQILNATCFGL